MDAFARTSEVVCLFRIDRRTLYNKIQTGSLIRGKHYLDVSCPNDHRPSYRWNIKALEELWSSDPARR